MTNPTKPEPTQMHTPNAVGPACAPENQASSESVSSSSGATLPEAAHPPVALPKIVAFEELARCGEEIWISHRGQLYRLQSTKAGKLILTK